MYSFLNSVEVSWNTFRWNVYDGTMSIHMNIFGVPKGIYIIWYIDIWGNPVTVYVGQGNIKQRLRNHRLDPAIRNHNFKELYVSWTPILYLYLRNSVERYLGETLKPLVGSDYPVAMKRYVKLPWEN